VIVNIKALYTPNHPAMRQYRTCRKCMTHELIHEHPCHVIPDIHAHPPSFCLVRAAARAEGELIRHKAAEEAAELAAKEAAWRAKAKEMNAATKASNDTLLAFRAAERERDRQLEAAVEGGHHTWHVPPWLCFCSAIMQLAALLSSWV